MAGVDGLRRVWLLVAAGFGVPLLILGNGSLAVAQDEAEKLEEIERVQQEIGLLQQFKRIGLTGEQRLAMAQAIAAYQAERQAAAAPADVDALANALWAVKAALLANQDPTPQTWQAVQAARGQGPDQEDPLGPVRQKALADLIGLLTPEQQLGLVLPSAAELAQSMLGQVARIRQLPEEQRPQAMQETLAQISRQVTQAIGVQQVEQVRGVFQGLVERFRDARPQDIMQQRDQIVGELGQQLQPLLTVAQEQIQQRLAGQMNGWLESEMVLLVLTESAEAMGAGAHQ